MGEPAKHVTHGSLRSRDSATAYAMLAPSMALITIFVVVPLIMAVGMSFTNTSIYGKSTFIGLQNFIIVLKTQDFRQSLLNVFLFVAIIVPLQLVLSFLFAHALKEVSSGFGAFVKTSLYLPNLISGIVAAVVFAMLFNYQGGIVNQILISLGLERIAFFRDHLWAIISIVVPSIWLGFGYNVLVMYAGILNIPKEHYEAAMLDGAGVFSRMFRITVPGMKNIFVLLSIGLITGTLQMFELPFMLTGGGPLNQTLTPMLYIYNNFRDPTKNLSYTIAGALLLMLVILVVNSVVFTIIKSEKSMEG